MPHWSKITVTRNWRKTSRKRLSSIAPQMNSLIRLSTISITNTIQLFLNRLRLVLWILIPQLSYWGPGQGWEISKLIHVGLHGYAQSISFTSLLLKYQSPTASAIVILLIFGAIGECQVISLNVWQCIKQEFINMPPFLLCWKSLKALSKAALNPWRDSIWLESQLWMFSLHLCHDCWVSDDSGAKICCICQTSYAGLIMKNGVFMFLISSCAKKHWDGSILEVQSWNFFPTSWRWTTSS